MANSGNVSTLTLLKQLSSVSQTLSQASNKLTEQIKEIETSLASYNLGVEAWVELPRTTETIDEHIQPVDHIERLGYSKENGKWGLYASSEVAELQHFECWLLRDAPRELRVLAVDAIPQLLETMVIRARELTAEVMSKTDRAKSIAHSLRKKQKKGE